MTTIAVTGHLDLTEGTVPLVRAALDALLGPYAVGGRLVGVSCIAKGADTLFAEAVLALGGRLVVVTPSRDYRRNTVEAEHGVSYDRLVEAAGEVVVLPYETAYHRRTRPPTRYSSSGPIVSSPYGTALRPPAAAAAPPMPFSQRGR